MPDKPRSEPEAFLDERDLARQLHRCLNPARTPVHLGVVGALILLYGLPIPQVLRLTRDDVLADTVGTRLRVGGRTVPLPPRLADLVNTLITQPTPPATTTRIAESEPSLFPGRTAHRPINPATLHSQLRRHGITARPGRNSARAALAADLPTSVFADVSAVSLATAQRWTRAARRDAIDYIAARRRV